MWYLNFSKGQIQVETEGAILKKKTQTNPQPKNIDRFYQFNIFNFFIVVNV